VDAPPPGGHEAALDVESRRRFVADRLHLVPPPSLPQAMDRRERVARLFAVLESHVIPQLVGYHAKELTAPAMKPTEAEFEEFFGHLLEDHEAGFVAAIHRLLERGLTVESIYLNLLVPSAVRMGQRWVDDCSDFVAVTVAVGRLQALLREFSRDFCAEVSPRAPGRRILLAQPDDETHMFGLSVVAEFFRRDGWDVFWHAFFHQLRNVSGGFFHLMARVTHFGIAGKRGFEALEMLQLLIDQRPIMYKRGCVLRSSHRWFSFAGNLVSSRSVQQPRRLAHASH
jgi:hypothetical protein